MFGLSKNKQQESTAQPAASENIPDDKFTVMPSQYLPTKGKVQSYSSPGSGINKKFLVLGGASLSVLLIIGAVLYFVFSSQGDDSNLSAIESPALNQNIAQDQQEVPQEQEEENIKEKIIQSQYYDESNNLLGEIQITIPPTVAQAFGQGIGTTVLDPNDLSLPEEGTIIGGLYSIYPNSISFEEPLSIEITASNIPEEAEQADLYPAYLRGVKWQELEDYQATEAGFAFLMEKVPLGPIAIIWKPIQDSGISELIIFSRPVPSIDTDQDGLTDSEERLLGTSSSSPDSDEDTYLDLEEMLNGYSPLLGEGAKLSDSGIFGVYTNATYGYKASYPAKWLADSLDQTNKQVLFISETEEFFEILIEENPLNTPIVDWYRAQSPSLKSADINVAVVDSRPGVWSQDGLTLYVSKDGLIYIITYNSGTREEISWPNMFEMFYKSFSFGNTGTETTTPDSM